MLFFHNSRIRTKLFLFFLLIILILVSATGFILYSKLHTIIKTNIESELKNSTKSILHMVKSSLDAAIKNYLRSAAKRNKEILAYLHKKQKQGSISLANAKLLAKNILLSQKIGNTGYIYAINSQGTIILHPKQKLFGSNLATYAFIKKQIKRKEGFLTYLWKNPDEKKEKAKALYMLWFKPWDWIISVSAYKKEFIQLLDIENFRKKILSLSFKKSGYSYIIDLKGNVVIHPYIRGNFINATDLKGIKFIQKMIRTRSGTIIYDWKNPGEKKLRKKLVAYTYISDMDWIVASCSYMDEFYAPLDNINNFFWIITLIATIIAAILSALLSSYITTPLLKMIKNFEKGSLGELGLRMEVGYKDELGQLALYFNKFMEKLSELNSKEAQLRQAQKMEVVGTLAGGLAHDFNNILAAIQGNASLIRESLSTNEETESLIGSITTIEQASQRAAEVVQQLLTLSRKNELKAAVVDLNKIISNVTQICKITFDKRIKISTHVTPSPALVLIDPAGIEQVLLNLCINASHSMTIMRGNNTPQGGELTISLQALHDSKEKHHPKIKTSEHWQISISDTGVGISKEQKEKIFDPFFTTKDKAHGTGLGLSMAYSILNKFNGTISVESTPSIGSTFTITLPATSDKQTDLPPKKEKIKHGSGKVLIIDDEDIVRNVASTILNRSGYTTIVATTPHEGIELFKKNHESLYAVMLDMVMPELSGLEVYQEIQKINSDIPVIISSGFKQDERVQQLLLQPNTSFINKPFDMADLATAFYEIKKEDFQK